MSGIQRKIFAFAIALTFWGKAHATCSADHVEYKNAGDAAYNSLYDFINIAIHNSTEKPLYMNKLNQSLTQFLQDSFKYCVKNRTITTESFTEYMKVVEFSVRNVTALKELEKNGALKCVRNQKAYIDKCIKEEVNENITLFNQYSRLHAKSHLAFNSLACDQARKVKTCVLKVIENNKCDKATKYVGSLFDFVIDNHCEDQNKTIIPNASVNMTGHWSFFIMVSFWSALFLYKW